jgi:hypothetical protein
MTPFSFLTKINTTSQSIKHIPACGSHHHSHNLKININDILNHIQKNIISKNSVLSKNFNSQLFSTINKYIYSKTIFVTLGGNFPFVATISF